MTIEGFTIMIIFKNFFSFVLTFYAYDWINTGGIKTTLVAISSIQVGVCLLSIPMCKHWNFFLYWQSQRLIGLFADVYGKRIRAFYHRHDLLALAGLR